MAYDNNSHSASVSNISVPFVFAWINSTVIGTLITTTQDQHNVTTSKMAIGKSNGSSEITNFANSHNVSSFLSYLVQQSHDLSIDDDYVYDENSTSLYLGEVIPVGMIYGLTLLLGVIGNFLVIFSIARFKRMRNITNMFILSLATADLLLVVVCVPVKCIRFFTFTWRVGAFLCKYVYYTQNVSMICSVMTLTVMSVERYIAIVYPLRAKSICTWRHAISVVVIIWILSLVLSVPILFGQKMVTVGPVPGRYYWCIKEWPESLGKVYELYMLVILFVIPVCVMVVAYTGIQRELWRMMSHRAMMCVSTREREDDNKKEVNAVVPARRGLLARRKTVQTDDDVTRKQVVYMLAVIVVLFALCWGPILINNVLVEFQLIDQLNYGALKPIRQAFFLMSYFNSCVNPIVYSFMSKNFRRAFRQALCSCVPERRSAVHSRQWSLKTHSTNFSYSRRGNTNVKRQVVFSCHGDETEATCNIDIANAK